jgi:hypothetical protein
VADGPCKTILFATNFCTTLPQPACTLDAFTGNGSETLSAQQALKDVALWVQM